MKAAVILLLASSLTGCGVTSQYVHSDPNKTQQQAQAESYDCRTIAYQYSANVGSPSNPFIIADQYNICMQQKYGYRLVPK